MFCGSKKSTKKRWVRDKRVWQFWPHRFTLKPFTNIGALRRASALAYDAGFEGVGRVTEIAPDVDSLSLGQTVMLAGYNTWQEEVVGPASSFIILPETADVCGFPCFGEPNYGPASVRLVRRT